MRPFWHRDTIISNRHWKNSPQFVSLLRDVARTTYQYDKEWKCVCLAAE